MQKQLLVFRVLGHYQC